MKAKRRLIALILMPLTLSSCQGIEPSFSVSVRSEDHLSSEIDESGDDSSGPIYSGSPYNPGTSSLGESSQQSSAHSHVVSEMYSYDETHHWKICYGCDEKIDYAPHEFIHEKVDPTYTREGYTIFHCRVCNYTYRAEYVPALSHHYAAQWSVDEEKGTHYHACIDEGYTHLRGDEAPHSYEETVVEPTEISEGYTTHTCSVCLYSYNDSIVPPLGLHYSDEWSIDEQNGTHYHACVDEGYEQYRGDEAPHTFVDSVTEPTFTSEGYTTHTCSVCNYSYTDSITPPKGHNYSEAWSVDEQNGTHYHACIDEGYEQYRSDEAPHDYGEWETIIDSTETESGLEGRECNICHYSEDREVPSLSMQCLSFRMLPGAVGYAVSSCAGLHNSITIPDTYNDLPVLSIDDEAFAGLENLSSLRLPSTLKTLGAMAFENCSSLETLVLPESLNSIGNSAFAFCSSLTELSFPDGLEYMGRSALFGCSSLVRLSIPFIGESAEQAEGYIGYLFGAADYASNDYVVPTSLKSVEIGNGCLGIPDYAFAYCRTLLEVVFPENLLSIGKEAFFECAGLMLITLPSTLSSIGENAFYGCAGLAFVINHSPLDITLGSEDHGMVAYYAEEVSSDEVDASIIIDGDFYVCRRGEETMLVAYGGNGGEVVIPSYINKLRGGVFTGNREIVSVIIPDGIETIPSSAFSSCPSLESVSLPNTLKSLGVEAFSMCGKLKSIVIPEGVTTIEAAAFSTCRGLLSVSLPSTLERIEDDAFFGCEKLASIVLPSSLNFIGEATFYHCSSLRQIVIPEGISAIPRVCFAGCDALETAVLPSTITYIGDSAFSRAGIRSIVIPEGVTAICENTFYNCPYLMDVSLPSTLKTIDDQAFASCPNLYSISIPSGITSIHQNAFAFARHLVEVSSPIQSPFSYAIRFFGSDEQSHLVKGSDGFVKLCDGDHVYLLGCLNNEEVLNVPNDVTDIIPYAFMGYTHIKRVHIPDSVKTIGDYAFHAELTTFPEPMHLEEVTIGSGIEFIGFDVFTNLNSLVFNEYQGGKYFGNSSNPYSVLIGMTDKSLSSYEVHPSCRIIYQQALSECSNLETLVLPEGLRHIGDKAFLNCSSLKELRVPDSTLYIGNNVDSGCVELKTLYVPFLGHDREHLDSFVFNRDITNLTLGASITELPDSVFRGMENLESLTCLGQITRVEALAFFECGKIKEFDFSYVEYIGDGAFNGARLTAFEATNKLKYIGRYAFSGCDLLYITLPYLSQWDDEPFSIGYLYGFENWMMGEATIVLLQGWESVPDNAFEDAWYINRVVLPTGMKTIGNKAFLDCRAMKQINLPSSLTSIGDWAFGGCESLVSVSFPNGLTHLGSNAFHSCSSITEVSLPSSLLSVGNYAFASCSGLIELSLPSAMETIGEGAFLGCAKLYSLILPFELTSIGTNAFYGCKHLVEIINRSRLNLEIGSEENGCIAYYARYIGSRVADKRTNLEGDFVYYEEGNDLFLIAYYGSSSEITIKEGVTVFTKDVLPEDGVTSITLPDSLRLIEEGAFDDCRALQYTVREGVNYLSSPSYPAMVLVSVEDKTKTEYDLSGVRFILKNSIVGCENLTILNIPNTVIYIAKGAIGRCYSLNEITLPFLGTSRFNQGRFIDIFTSWEDRSPIEKIVLLEATEELMNSAFKMVGEVKEIVLPDGIVHIGDSAFAYCGSLKSVVIPSSVVSIGNDAFGHCSDLETIVIPSSVVSIGDGVFANCSSLSSLTLPITDENWQFGRLFGAILNKTSLYYENEGYLPSESLKEVIINRCFDSVPSYSFYRCSSIASVFFLCEATSIGDGAFRNCSSLSSIILPSGAESISEAAFYSCSSLETLILRPGLKSIGYMAFSYCPSLKSVSFPDGLLTIGESAFSSCGSLARVELPSSLTSIGWNTFYGCYGLTSMTLPFVGGGQADNAYLGYIFGGDRRRQGAPSSLKEVRFLSSLTEIPDYAFEREEFIESFVFEGAITHIGDFAFAVCSALKAFPSFDGLQSIGVGAFGSCAWLRTITLPEGVQSIGEGAFANCRRLYQISLPSSLESISSEAFGNCTYLISVINHSSLVLSLGGDDYGGIASYAKEIIESEEDSRLIIDDDFLIYVENALYKLYGYIGFETALSVPSYIDCITSSAFDGITIESLYIPYNCHIFETNSINHLNSSVYNQYEGCYYLGNHGRPYTILIKPISTDVETVSIHDDCGYFVPYAFSSCRELTEITLPMKLEEIPDQCFQWCVSLQSVHVLSNNRIKTIGGGAFTGCESLVSLDDRLTGGVEKIGYGAFFGCSSLTRLFFEKKNIEIGNRAFQDCTSLTAIVSASYIPELVLSTLQSITITDETSLPDYAFANCSSLEEINLPEGLLTIGEYAFASTGTTSSTLVIPSTVTSLGYGCLKDSRFAELTLPFIGGSKEENNTMSYLYANGNNYPSSLKGIYFNGTFDTVAANAFYNAQYLEWVELPNAIRSIGDYAFNNCYSLKGIGESHLTKLSSIGQGAFGGCKCLYSFYIPESLNVVSIGEYAFAGCDYLVEILNASTYDYKCGDTIGGGIAEHAIHVDNESNNSYVQEEDGFIYYTYNGEKTLVRALSQISSYTSSDYGVTSIAAYAFRGKSTLTEIDLSSVTSIGDYAFLGCSSYTSLTLSDSLTKMGKNPFPFVEGSSTLYGGAYYLGNQSNPYLFLIQTEDDITSLSVADGCRFIDFGAVKSSSLTYAALPFAGGSENENTRLPYIFGSEDLEKFNSRVPSALKTVLIKEGCENLGDYAFYGCFLIQTVSLPSTLAHIGSNAFTHCSLLQDLTLPFLGDGTSNAYLGYLFGGEGWIYNGNVVSSNSNLQTVTLREGVTSLEEGAFYGCSSISAINLPSSLTSIGARTFEGCSNLSSLELPSSLRKIGKDAFKGCDSLSYAETGNGRYLASGENLYFALIGTIEGYETFRIASGCIVIADGPMFDDLLEEIYIPESVLYLGEELFENTQRLAQVNYVSSHESWLAIQIGLHNDYLYSANHSYNVTPW